MGDKTHEYSAGKHCSEKDITAAMKVPSKIHAIPTTAYFIDLSTAAEAPK